MAKKLKVQQLNTRQFIIKMTLVLLASIMITSCKSDKNAQLDTVTVINSTSTSDSTKSKVATEANFNLAQVLKDYPQTPLTILDVSERSKDGRNAIAVTLSVPLNPAIDQQKYLAISNINNQPVDGAWQLSASGRTLWFPYTDASSQYQVTIYQGITAANQQQLKASYQSTISTKAISPSVNFDSKGAFLTAGLGNGLPIVAINVAEVDINFYRIKEQHRQDFLQTMRNNRYYWRAKHYNQYGELVYSGRYQLAQQKNTRAKHTINIEGIDSLSEPGIYLAIMTPAGSYQQQKFMWFSITDIGLHARFYDKTLSVFASSLASGQPLTELDISLINNKGEIIQQARSSADGQVIFNHALPPAGLIIAQNAQHFSVIEINKPALDLSEFDIGLRANKAQELFIYTARDIFRPGEDIDFNALLRDNDGKLLANSILSATITTPSGSKIKTFNWHSQTLGYYHYQWQIPENAQLGAWQLTVTTVSNNKVTFNFNVEDFLPERLKLTFLTKNEKNQPLVSNSKHVSLAVQGQYLYGAPAAGNKLSTQVSTSLWRKPIASLADFEFGDINAQHLRQRITLEDQTLDQQGLGNISFRPDWQQLNSPVKVNFISSLYETGGRAITRTQPTLIWPKPQMLGIRSHFSNNNPEANSRVSFDIIKASVDGTKHPAKALDIKLIREDRRYFWVYSNDRGWHYEWHDNEYVTLTRSLTLDADNLGQISLPVTWGNYRLEVREHSQQLLTSTRFYAGWNWYENWQNSQQGSGAARPDQVTMALDKATYHTGDTIKVKVIPPQAGEALIMVEAEQPLWQTRQYIPAEGAIISIPVHQDWQQHNIYISALVLQAASKQKTMTPKRSFGLIHLPLARENRKLQLELTVAERALPDQALPVKVKINNLTTTDSAYITLAAVDVGILAVSDFISPDPVEAFFGQRRYQVDARDVYDQVIEVSQAPQANLRFGGDSDLSHGGKKPQSDVQIVSIFSGLVTVNELGEAHISLDIPYFNGRLKLMALAFSADKFGQTEQEVTIAAPLVSQITMPRFLALGDHSNIGLDITNISGQPQEIKVDFTASGGVSAINKQQNISLANNEKTTLTYQVTGKDIKGQANFSLQIQGKQLEKNIKRHWSLGLRPAYPALRSTYTKMLTQDESFTLPASAISDLIPNSIQAKATITNHADIDLDEQLSQLLQYPYGCLEQTTSRAYPLLFADQEQQKNFSLKKTTKTERIKMINQALERLATLQLSNGGYSLWSNTGREAYWLTAYVADFLVNARDMGLTIPKQLFTRTLTRLQQYLARNSHFYDEPRSDNAQHYYFAYQAYAAYVLAKVNQVPLSTLRNLANHHSQHAETGLSQLHLAIALDKMGDHKYSQILLKQALNNLPRQDRPYLADYGSQIRDLAMMIQLMLSHQFASDEAIKLSFTLATQLKNKSYLSTQERNAVFLAGRLLISRPQTAWTAQLTLNQHTEILNHSGRFSYPLSLEQLSQGLKIQSQHATPLFSQYHINGYSKTPPKPSSSGLTIQKTWLNLAGQQQNLASISQGELLIVQLQINAEQLTPDTLVVDLLPAGFELENQNLTHSIKLADIIIAGKSIKDWQQQSHIQHQEFRADRYLAAIKVDQHQTQQLFYLVRAVTPGKYQVPPALAEDMYRPEIRAVGNTMANIQILGQ